MQGSDTIRVLVFHEDPIVEAGLTTILRAAPGLSVATRPACALPKGKLPELGGVDVMVTDYRGGLDMLEAAKSDSAMQPVPRVFVVTQFAREWEVRLAMNAGVFGYVLQNCGLGEIVNGVRMAGYGRRYLCDAVSERIAESLTRVGLTARETEVLELLQQGMCNKTIARGLGIEPGTVKAHVKRILGKLESTTRTQAVSVAAHRGLIRPGGARLIDFGHGGRHLEIRSELGAAQER